MVDIASSGLEKGFSKRYPVIGKIGKYNVTRKIGEGFSASIRLAHTDDGTSYALKIFDLQKKAMSFEFMTLLKEEINATLNFNHENIVKYYEFEEKAEFIKNSGRKYPVAYIA